MSQTVETPDQDVLVVTGNPDTHPQEPTDTIEAPLRPDGTAYAFEMLYAGMTRRAYADTADLLLDALIPGYSNGDHHTQWTHRLTLAARAQVLTQAVFNAEPQFARATVEQREILAGTRHEPVIVPHWDCPVPLVLIAPSRMQACPRTSCGSTRRMSGRS
jgi:hypothetical protein